MKKMMISALLVLVSAVSFASMTNIKRHSGHQGDAAQQQSAAAMPRVPEWNR
ncbi:hypothetical protein [Piscirickettsia litoralis]|uniref:hypothetical protein n=1 Tax=Piscirickettsia litoralis TaxID=1891921 RepID=UPI0013011175|nr:hypothetical protein [Piscirickettsia litoralis]